MKVLVILIITILTASDLKSQIDQSLMERAQNLEVILNKLDASDLKWKCDSTGLSELPEITTPCISRWEQEKSHFHVVDLNMDGLNDLIYTGPCSPYNETFFFLNLNGKLQMVHSSAGILTSLVQTNTSTVAQIFASACCCEYSHHFFEIKIENGKIFEQPSICMHSETDLKVDSSPGRFFVDQDLRISPEIDDEVKVDPCTDEPIYGNLFGSHNGTALQLYKKKNWSLVLAFEEQAQRYIIGWVSP